MMTTTTDHLLSGYRILDFTRALAGPTCTRMFAEMGAEVIKVEAAPNGDMVRALCKFRNDRSFYYVQQNLNKRSLCLDLRRPEAQAILRELVPQCDVVVENFKPGVIAKMGFAYEELKSLREDIILCSLSALGQSGPLADKPGYDFIAQAYSGITSMIGDPEAPPYLPLAGIGDVSTGVHAAFAIAAALLYRDRTGRGQHLDVALLDCYYHYHEVNVLTYSGTDGGVEPQRGGRHLSYVCPAGVFAANGGAIVIMAFLHHWPDLCTAMGREDLTSAPGWATDPERLSRRDEVVSLIENWLAKFPDVNSAIAALEEAGVPCAPVLSVAQTCIHPHLLERGTVRTVHDRLGGEFQIPGHPIKSSEVAANQAYAAPLLGEHNTEILQEMLDKSADDVAALTENGVLFNKEI